jgi:uncharacterized membrane protein YhiD involved in acid resistance
LIFLFLAIAIGLGLGADQRIPTLVAIGFILIYLIVRAYLKRRNKSSHSLYMNIQVENPDSSTTTFSAINDLLLNEFPQLDLRRMDHSNGYLQVTYYLEVRNQPALLRVMDALSTSYPGSSVSLVEQNNLLGG